MLLTDRQRVSNIFLANTMVINGKETERFEHFTEAVQWVMQKLEFSNQEATWFVHDNKFTVGTDRAIWITV